MRIAAMGLVHRQHHRLRGTRGYLRDEDSTGRLCHKSESWKYLERFVCEPPQNLALKSEVSPASPHLNDNPSRPCSQLYSSPAASMPSDHAAGFETAGQLGPRPAKAMLSMPPD